jgi:hypothetical protein
VAASKNSSLAPAGPRRRRRRRASRFFYADVATVRRQACWRGFEQNRAHPHHIAATRRGANCALGMDLASSKTDGYSITVRRPLFRARSDDPEVYFRRPLQVYFSAVCRPRYLRTAAVLWRLLFFFAPPERTWFGVTAGNWIYALLGEMNWRAASLASARVILGIEPSPMSRAFWPSRTYRKIHGGSRPRQRRLEGTNFHRHDCSS